MTKQEAIDVLQNTIVRFGRSSGKTVYAEALDMAIEALQVGHAQCNDCHYRYHWMTQRMNGQNGGATA